MLHIVKLSVGIETVEQLEAVQARRLAEAQAAGRPVELLHRTLQRPRRDAEVLAGGSLYWVIRGAIRARQRIRRIDDLVPPQDGKKVAFVLAPELVRTEPWGRRPHQGWRYLAPKDAPPDLPPGGAADEAPPEMLAELRALGLI